MFRILIGHRFPRLEPNEVATLATGHALATIRLLDGSGERLASKVAAFRELIELTSAFDTCLSTPASTTPSD
jgi:hypothetical protein